MYTARFIFFPLLIVFLFVGCEKNPPTGFAPTNFDPSAPWQRLNGPNGGRVLSVAISGATTLAGTDGGLFLSTNNGLTWTAATSASPLSNATITNFVRNGDSLFALANNGILVSTNDGSSWTEFASPNYYANTLAFSDSGIFAATDNGVFVLSKSDGKQWVATGLRNLSVSALATRASTLFAGTYSSGFFRSIDGGTTWTISNLGLSRSPVYALAVVGSNLLAGGDPGIFLSSDDGSDWNQVAAVPAYVGCFVVDGARVLAGSMNGIFRSTDGGLTWNSTSVTLANKTVASIATNGNYWIVGTYDGPYVSTDNGNIWTLCDSGLTNTNIQDMAVIGSNLLASVSNKGVFVSTNQGNDWKRTNLSGAYAANFSHCGMYDFVTVSGTIYRSLDHGTSWTNVSSLTGEYSSITSMAGTNTRLYAGTYDGIYVSTDYGLNWTKLRPRFKNSTIHILAADENYVFAGGYDGVYRSTDNGNTWTEMDFDIPYPQFSAIGICRATVFLSSYGNGAYFSNDYGANWTHIEWYELQNQGVEEFLVVGTDIFASTYSNILVSHDNGMSWISTGLRYSSVTSLASDGVYLYAGTSYSGMWRHSL